MIRSRYINLKYQNWIAEALSNWTKKESIESFGEEIKGLSFDSLIFPEDKKQFLKLIMQQMRIKPLDLLMFGHPGTGKTYTSKVLACELNKPFIYLNGQMNQKRIVEIILNAKDNALILIDEAHNLPDKVQETIYPAVEYREISDNGELKKVKETVSFILTTTELDEIPKPLQNRLLNIQFDEPDKELCIKILTNMQLSDDVIINLIKYTQNIRKLKHLVKYMDLYGVRSFETLRNVFKMSGIDINSGLSFEQIKYLEYLKSHDKASLRALSLYLRRSENYIKTEVEEDLVRKDLIIVSSRGRQVQSSGSSSFSSSTS